jgi:hypothetical protein
MLTIPERLEHPELEDRRKLREALIEIVEKTIPKPNIDIL